HQGWTRASTQLANERGPAFVAHQIRFRNRLEDVIAMAKRVERDGVPLSKHPAFRDKLIKAYADLEVMRVIGYRTVTSILRHGRPGVEGSIAKLYWSEMVRRMELLALLLEELGAALAPVPFLSSVVFTGLPILRRGSDEQKRRWLPDVASGDRVGAVVLPSFEHDVDTVSIRAEATGSPASDRTCSTRR